VQVADDLSNAFPDLQSLQVGVEVSLQDANNHHHPNTTATEATLQEFLEESKTTVEQQQQQHGDKTFFWQSKGSRKVSSTDVASVGNASDTAVSVNSAIQVTGRDLHEAAKKCLNAGDYPTALPQFEAILAAQVRRFGCTHASVGAAAHNVGVCRQRMRHYAQAEGYFGQAVQIRVVTLGDNHADTAASLAKLGQTRVFLRKLDPAHADLRRALKIARQTLGVQHKTVAVIQCHTAVCYFEAGEFMAAQGSFQDAVDIYRQIWKTEGDRDACMAQLTDALCNIGSIQNRRKRFEDAVVTFKEALDLQRGILGHDSPRVVATHDNLAYSYSKTRDYASALQCYKKMLRAQVSRTGTFSDECLETFRKQILMYEKLKLLAEAVDEIKETLRLQKSMMVPKHSLVVAATKDMLDDLSKKLKRSKSGPAAV
jgi:tetratricopeptide (TPR) repeat protein